VRYHEKEIALPVWTDEDISPHQTKFATDLRIPFLTDPRPSWQYITGVVISELWGGEIPTNDELGEIALWLETHCNWWYRPSWRKRMVEFAPYDIDNNCLGILMKRADDDWCFTRLAWTSGPTFVPMVTEEPSTLLGVLERARPRWRDRALCR